ncbi:MAG: S-layer homology domain-containing protein [Clostridia bacterium]|nr:S-layer homology domain-containing protein [Clostridia bacterium]
MKKIIVALVATLALVIGAYSMSHAEEYKYKYPDLEWTEYDKIGRPINVVHPAAREIVQATNIGVMNGYPDGYFRPDEPIIRCEFIKMLIGLATNRSFDFASTDSEYTGWYGPYVTIAEMQGVIDKNQYTLEELEEPITRLEMILMLSKTQIRMKGIPQTQIGTLVYTDIANLTQEEKDLILHAADYDLLEGMKDGTEKLLQPNKYLTRGEAAAALMRIY